MISNVVHLPQRSRAATLGPSLKPMPALDALNTFHIRVLAGADPNAPIYGSNLAMNQHKNYTTEQRLAGAFYDADQCACIAVETLDLICDPAFDDERQMLVMVSLLSLMVRRLAYINQFAAHLACPGLLEEPNWGNWMYDPVGRDYSPPA